MRIGLRWKLIHQKDYVDAAARPTNDVSACILEDATRRNRLGLGLWTTR